MSTTGSAPDHHIAIIGAGLGGTGMAIALIRAGIDDFVVLERAADIGGTWRDNTCPGIAVDIPAQAYQFSYELKPDWSRVFARGAEVKQYIDHCADRYGLRRRIRLNSEVLSRRWDEEGQRWRLSVPDGELTARFVISAVGAFVNPKPPHIFGLDDFRGQVLQSAAWDDSLDLTGRRVAVIGTGASAIQIIPEIAASVGRLDVYQRTPIWVGPKFDPLRNTSTGPARGARPGTAASDGTRCVSAAQAQAAAGLFAQRPATRTAGHRVRTGGSRSRTRIVRTR